MSRKHIAAIVIAALLVLAGCTGGTTTAPGDQTGDQVNASTIQTDALEEMTSVSSYKVTGNTTIHISANGQTQRQTIDLTAAIDRSNDRFQVNQTIAVRGISQTTQIYYVDGTIYQHNEMFSSQYGSEWVKVNQTDGIFVQLDSLDRQRALLANATVTLNQTTPDENSTTYVLDGSLNESASEAAMGARLDRLGMGSAQINVTDATQRVWIDQETTRPVRTLTNISVSITSQGQTATMEMHSTLAFEYDTDVSVTLPAEADSAVPLDGSKAS